MNERQIQLIMQIVREQLDEQVYLAPVATLRPSLHVRRGGKDERPLDSNTPEEIAYINGWIGKEKLTESAELYGKSPYGMYLKAVAQDKIRY